MTMGHAHCMMDT